MTEAKFANLTVKLWRAIQRVEVLEKKLKLRVIKHPQASAYRLIWFKDDRDMQRFRKAHKAVQDNLQKLTREYSLAPDVLLAAHIGRKKAA